MRHLLLVCLHNCRRTSPYYHIDRESTGSRSSTLRENSLSKASDMVRKSQNREVKKITSSRSTEDPPPVPPKKKKAPLTKTVSYFDTHDEPTRGQETRNESLPQKGHTLGHVHPLGHLPEDGQGHGHRILKKMRSLVTLSASYSERSGSFSASWSPEMKSPVSRTPIISAPVHPLPPLGDVAGNLAAGDSNARLKRGKAVIKRKPSSIDLCSSQIVIKYAVPGHSE